MTPTTGIYLLGVTVVDTVLSSLFVSPLCSSILIKEETEVKEDVQRQTATKWKD